MPDGLFPGELPYKDLQKRVRRWVVYIWKRCEAGGTDQKGFGEYLGFQKSTINNLVKSRELPGLQMLSRIAFRFPQWSADEILKTEPPAIDSARPAQPLALPAPGPTLAHPARVAARK